MVVYFLLSPDGLCKIGTSDNPSLRQKRVAREVGSPLTLWHVIETNDGYWLEAKFHRYFNDRRYRGEWFLLAQKELDAIREVVRHDRLMLYPDFDAPQSPGPLTPHAKAIGRKGGLLGGHSRASKLTPEQRSAIARLGGRALQAKRKGNA